jgi:hypothetical protein
LRLSLRGPACDESLLTFDFVESQFQGVEFFMERWKTVVLDCAKASMSRGEFHLDGAQCALGGGVARGRLEGSHVRVARWPDGGIEHSPVHGGEVGRADACLVGVKHAHGVAPRDRDVRATLVRRSNESGRGRPREDIGTARPEVRLLAGSSPLLLGVLSVVQKTALLSREQLLLLAK